MGPLAMLAALAGAAAIAFGLMQLLKYFDQLDKESSTALVLQLEDPNSLTPLACPSVWAPATKQLSVVIPAYNEEDRLPGTLDETLGYLQRRRNKQGPAFTYEVIIVDDGSKDSTAAVALGYVKTHGIDAVRLLRLPYNCGKGRAVREGMLIARGQSCLFMDADGATRVSDMELLEAALQEVGSNKDSTVAADSKAANGAANGTAAAVGGSSAGLLAAAVGSRAHLEQEALAQRSRLRNFLMHGFHMLVVFVAGGAVKDTQCGFKMFSRHAAALLYTNQRLQRWCFDVELLYLCGRLRVPVKEVQVKWVEMPGSKIRASSIVHMAFELAVIKLAYQWLRLWQVRTDADDKGAAAKVKAV